MTGSKKASNDWFTALSLFALWLVVYSGSSFLAKMVLSLYGLIHGMATFQRKRVSAAKSIFCYGMTLIQKKLSSEDAF